MTSVRLDLASFGQAKDGYRSHEWEDSAAHSFRSGRFAVADGATTAFRARAWSHILTAGWLSDPFAIDDDDEWVEWLARRAAIWDADLDGREDDAPFYVVAAANRGSFATLLGVELGVDDGELCWRALAVGDACLFHVREGALLQSFPVTDAAEFGSHPALVHSGTTTGPGAVRGVERARGSLIEGDRVLLATDALAEWALLAGSTDPGVWERLGTIDEEGFGRLIAELRAGDALRNDDVTLLRCGVSISSAVRR
ncbi:MAG: hypothetical protein RIB98_11560 [Acidimicrobiales bacterium]